MRGCHPYPALGGTGYTGKFAMLALSVAPGNVELFLQTSVLFYDHEVTAMVERVPMTRQGYEKMKGELDHLKKVVRPQVVRDIQEAREHGDIQENAEFHAAKEHQSFVEGKIQELTSKLSRAEVIDPATLKSDNVAFGATVKLEEVKSGEVMTYRIVGEDEASVENGRISVASPLARALIGKTLDEQIQVKTPGGLKEYIILDIRYE